MSFKKLVGSSICTAVLCTVVSAQETNPNQAGLPKQTAANQGARNMASHAMVTPQQIAACWALDNQEQVILAKFGQEKSKNKDVSNFAKMIGEEHQACLKKLSKFAPEATQEGYLVENQPDQSKSRSESSAASIKTDSTKDAIPTRTINQNATSSGSATSGIDMVQLQREISQQCISDTKKYLSAKEGDEFDKCFVWMQIAKHASMHTKLVVLQRHTSGEMQEMVTEGIQATAKHMKAGESLMAKLDDEESTTSTKKNK